MTTIKPAVDLAARAAVAARTEELFRASGALRDGHFQLKSGRHGDAYVEKFAVLADPGATSELVGYWVARLRGETGGAEGGRAPVDLVAGPTTGGIILAFETARQLGTLGIFAEEVSDSDGGTRREFRRGFSILPGERVLLVDDILTTGGSLLAMIPAVEALGGEIVEFQALTREQLGEIVELQLERLRSRLSERGLSLELTGRGIGSDGTRVRFADDLGATTARADARLRRLLWEFDRHAAIAGWSHLTDDGPHVSAPSPLAARSADLRARRSHLSALCGG